jgi:uncharacterized protein YuzE
MQGFPVVITHPPTVEIDTDSTAIYLRFEEGKVARTEPLGRKGSSERVDYDEQGKVLGILFIHGAPYCGVYQGLNQRPDYSIQLLLKGIPTQVKGDVLSRTQYVSFDFTRFPRETR